MGHKLFSIKTLPVIQRSFRKPTLKLRVDGVPLWAYAISENVPDCTRFIPRFQQIVKNAAILKDEVLIFSIASYSVGRHLIHRHLLGQFFQFFERQNLIFFRRLFIDIGCNAGPRMAHLERRVFQRHSGLFQPGCV